MTVLTATERRCAFCEAPLVGKRPQARYCDSMCRMGAWRGLEPPKRSVTVQVKSTAKPAPSGFQVPYFKALEHIRAALDAEADHDGIDDEWVVAPRGTPRVHPGSGP